MKLFVLSLLIYSLYSLYSTTPPRFGRETKEKLFLLDPKVYLNHGSYGAAPKKVIEKQFELIRMLEASPRTFITLTYPKLLKEMTFKLSNYIGAKEEDIVILENASAAVNSVLRSQKFNKGDKLMILSIEYGMVKNVIQNLVDLHGIEVVVVDIELPTNSKMILENIQKTIEKNDIKFAIFDHISSTPSMILPIKEIIQMMRRKSIKTLIDGAHVVGQIPLNITDLDPDFYFSNGHKWLLSSKGSAFLYVKKQYQSEILPTVISSYKTNFKNDFMYTGTRDYTNYLTFDEALNFRAWLSDEKVWEYNNNLCKNVSTSLSRRWNTILPVPQSMSASVINVRIPCNINGPSCYSWDIGRVMNRFTNEGFTIVIYEYKKIRYFRFECQIYNFYEEYLLTAQKFEEFIKE